MNNIRYLFPDREVLEKGEYYSQEMGIIQDALVYKYQKIIINRVSEACGNYCDISTGDEFSSKSGFVEVIFEGGIMRTSRTNIENILGIHSQHKDTKQSAA